MSSAPFDVTFSMNGDTFGFMLTSPPGEPKQLVVSEVPTPSGQYDLNRLASEDTRNNTDFEQQFDQVLAQSDFSGGVGQLDYDARSEPDKVWWAPGIVTHVPGKAFLAPPTTTLTIASGASTVVDTLATIASSTQYDFHWQGTRLYRRPATDTSTTWTLVYTASDPITNFYVFGAAGYICCPAKTGTTDFFYQSDITAAATWAPTARNHTAFSDALGKPKFFRSVRGTMYAFVDSRKVWYSTDPTTDSWVGPIDTSLTGNFSGPPGDTTYGFRNTKAINDFLFCFKDDAAYNIDSQQEITEALWQWKDKPSTANFKYVATGGDLLYYSVSPEIYAYDPQTGRNFSLNLSRKSGFSVQDILGLGADNNFVYILAKVRVPDIRSASSAVVIRAWRSSASVWDCEVLWEDTASTAYAGLAALPNGAGTRVYWFESGGAQSIHMDCAADYDESAGGTLFAASGTMYLSQWATGFASFMKRWLWLCAQADEASGSNTIAVHYSLDHGTTFTLLDTIITTDLNFFDFTDVISDGIIIRFTFAGPGTATPILRTYDLHGRVRWRYLEQGQATFRIADYIELNNGTRSADAATTLVANLEALRTADETITYQDFLGRSFNVSIDKLAFRATRHEIPDSKWEQECQVIFSRATSGS